MGSVRNRQMLADSRTQYKALLMDYDWIFSQTENGCLYCLDERQTALLLAAVEMYKWPTRWQSPTDTELDESAILRLVEGIEHELMSEKCSEFRTEFWRQRQQMIAVLNAQRAARYDGSAQSINPNCPATGQDFNYDGGSAGDAALCAACRAYVEHKLYETVNLMRVSAALAAIATGGLTALLGPLGLVLGGTVTLLATVGLLAAEAALADTNAIINVSCDLYNALRGVEVSFTNFWAAVTGLSGNGTNETTIVNILSAPIAQDMPNYLHFLDLLGTAKAQGTEVDECECGCIGPVGLTFPNGTGSEQLSSNKWRLSSVEQTFQGHLYQAVYCAGEANVNCFRISAVEIVSGGYNRYDKVNCAGSIIGGNLVSDDCLSVFDVATALDNNTPFVIDVTLCQC